MIVNSETNFTNNIGINGSIYGTILNKKFGNRTKLGQDIDGEAVDDYSGYSVSLSSDGTIVAIGAYGNDSNGAFSGHVRVYQYSGSSWTKIGQDIDGEAVDDYSGYSVSLSSDGTIVAIGAYGNDANGAFSGHVRVYQYSGSSWTQLGADIDGEAAANWCGRSVSLNSDGTIIAIGANLNNGDNGIYSGHVRLYKWRQYTQTDNDSNTYHYTSRAQNNTQTKSLIITENTSTAPTVGNYYWTQLGQDIDGEASNDQSGYSVSLSSDGTIVAIGAIYNATYRGHVRVYQYSGSSWTKIGQDIDGEAVDDLSGVSVSLSSNGTIVAIGAYGNDANGAFSGHVRVYHYSGSSWTKLGQDIDGEAAGDESGYSVSLSSDGTIVAIGASKNDDNGTDSGHVRVYQYIEDS